MRSELPSALETIELTTANVTEPAVRRSRAAVACGACAPTREHRSTIVASAPCGRAESNAQASAAERQQERKMPSKSTGRSEVPNAAASVIHGKKLLSRPNGRAKRPLRPRSHDRTANYPAAVRLERIVRPAERSEMPRALETTELDTANAAEPAVRRRRVAVACAASAPIREQ